MALEKIILAHTQGFCAGVVSAIEVVKLALEKYGVPLFVRHQIVHNTAVIREFESRGVVFIEDLSDVPNNNVVVFSAHGTAPEVFETARQRGLNILDATCPLVTKVHREAVKFSEKNIQTILIGHKGHQELLGTSGYVNQDLLFVIEDEADIDQLALNPDLPIGYLTQTTLSVDDTKGMIGKLKRLYPHIQGPPKSNICYATQNRQDAVKELVENTEVIIICGSPNSSNSNRLRETSENLGVPSYIIDSVDELNLSWLTGKKILGISSGASVPRSSVNDLVELLKREYPNAIIDQEPSHEIGIKFPIPNI